MVTNAAFTIYMTGHYQGLKQKLRAGCRTPSLQRTSWLPSTVTKIFIIKSGITWFLCAVHVFKVWASSWPHTLPLCQIMFLLQPP